MEASGEVTLVVNGTYEVTDKMLGTVTDRIPAAQLERMTETGQIDQLFEQVAIGEILYDRALKEGLLDDEDVKVGMAMSVRQYLAGLMVQRASEAGITEEAVLAKYEERAVQYKRPQINARHILVKEKSLADDLKGQLDGGADFAALAIEHSTDPGSGRKGGDLGWFEDGRMVAPFSEAAFAAEPNTLIGPIETRFGFHLIEVMEKRDATPLEDVRDSIETQLSREVQEAFLAEIKDGMTIERKGEGEGEGEAAGGDGSGPGKAPAPGSGEGKGDVVWY
jgi:peptidyl-prolyl cis-trans isomerase C